MLLRYHVSYHNECWKPGCDEESTLKDMGIIACIDYNDAVAKLDKFYGTDNIYEFGFMPLEDIITKEDFEPSCMGNIWD